MRMKSIVAILALVSFVVGCGGDGINGPAADLVGEWKFGDEEGFTFEGDASYVHEVAIRCATDPCDEVMVATGKFDYDGTYLYLWPFGSKSYRRYKILLASNSFTIVGGKNRVYIKEE